MTKIEEVAAAIKSRRDELIERPLARIYKDLAVAAVAAMRGPTPNMIMSGDAAKYYSSEGLNLSDMIDDDGIAMVFNAMVDAALAEHK